MHEITPIEKKPTILVFIEYYLPGYKSGGPVQTVSNMVEQLGDEFSFYIITSDRDISNDHPYDNIGINVWLDVGKAKVCYLTRDASIFFNIKNLLKNTSYDAIYLNSFFSLRFSILPVIVKKFIRQNTPIILAPRGEFSIGALRIKKIKKQLFILISKLIDLHKNVAWHTSSQDEKQDLLRIFTHVKDIHIAIDLPKLPSSHNYIINHSPNDTNTLRIIFLSRISPMKNLDYAIKTLFNAKNPITFDIYGPIEDIEYWGKCKLLISNLPNNIKANYCGQIKHEDVEKTFLGYDVFLFPTRGENYGHVIAESLSIGTPVIISDQTPWHNLKSDELGFDLPLDDPMMFTEALKSIARMTSQDKLNWRKQIRTNITKLLSDPNIVDANRLLFTQVIAGNKTGC